MGMMGCRYAPEQAELQDTAATSSPFPTTTKSPFMADTLVTSSSILSSPAPQSLTGSAQRAQNPIDNTSSSSSALASTARAPLDPINGSVTQDGGLSYVEDHDEEEGEGEV